jgi:hypothetical protein
VPPFLVFVCLSVSAAVLAYSLSSLSICPSSVPQPLVCVFFSSVTHTPHTYITPTEPSSLPPTPSPPPQRPNAPI